MLVSGPDTAAHARATLIVFFAMTQTAATLAFAFHGLLTGEVLWRALLLAPVFVQWGLLILLLAVGIVLASKARD